MTEMNQNPNARRPRAIDRILHSRGGLPQQPPPAAPQGAKEAQERQAFTDSGGKPQMAFSLVLASGEMHGFHYFNIDNLKYTPKPTAEFITFDHRGKVVVISGSGL